MNILPDLPGCGQPAARRIEIYSPANEGAHGTLDGSIDTCHRHAEPIRAAVIAAGLTAHSAPLLTTGSKCGDGLDFTGVTAKTLIAPPLCAGCGEPIEYVPTPPGRSPTWHPPYWRHVAGSGDGFHPALRRRSGSEPS